jgi:hypothetical protein
MGNPLETAGPWHLVSKSFYLCVGEFEETCL